MRCVQCERKYLARIGDPSFGDQRCRKCESDGAESPALLVAGFVILMGLTVAIFVGCIWIAAGLFFQ